MPFLFSSQETVLGVFLFVYVGMLCGGVPGLALNRAGVAVLGAIALVALGVTDTAMAWASMDVPTLALLFGLMILSAQFRLGGFYTAVARRITHATLQPPFLLGLVMLASALLSAVLANDIVCLAMAPILIEGCSRRDLAPLPFLLGLATAANIGSAATLIGNPQNMLIGQVARLPFTAFALDALPPAVAGLLAAWAILCVIFRDGFSQVMLPESAEAPAFNPWQTFKGLVALGLVIWAFIQAPVPREAAALAVGGWLLLSRRMQSARVFGLIDWQLLLLFMGLFVVNHALARAGFLELLQEMLAQSGLDLANPWVLGGVAVVLSNVVSNVPAVMLLLPACRTPREALVLAIASTLAGNLILVGSIANLIVADQARAMGHGMSWKDHARAGVPITLVTLGLAAAWLAWRWPQLALAVSP